MVSNRLIEITHTIIIQISHFADNMAYRNQPLQIRNKPKKNTDEPAMGGHSGVSFTIKLPITSSGLYYLSILSGPLLVCLYMSFMTLIPIHNVIEQPEYWYEDIITRVLAASPIHACMVMIRADYWAGFSFKDRWTSYVLMMGYVFVLYVCLLGGYYLVWTTYLGFYQPMPLNWLVVANVAVFGIYPAVPLR